MKTKVYTYVKWLTIVPLVGLCGCAGPALRSDSADYSEVYAQSINSQLLLNLARLSHNEPAYFIQLGTISSQFQFMTSAGFMPTHAGVSHDGGVAAAVVQNTLTLGGNLTASVTETPVFNFVPLNGSNYAQALAAPISSKVFLTFYDQGYHADTLVRTMVASVRRATIEGNQTHYAIFVNNPKDPTYPGFLSFCADLRGAQTNHTLVVQTDTNKSDTFYGDAKLSEAVSAVQAGLEITNRPWTNIVTTNDTNGGSRTNQSTANALWVTRSEESQSLKSVKVAVNDLPMFIETTNATTRFREASDFAATYTNYELNMRTFEAVMYAAAKEQHYYDALLEAKDLNSNVIRVYKDDYGPIVVVTHSEEGKPPETNAFRPIITLRFNDNSLTNLSKLVSINYEHIHYSVGDFERFVPTDGPDTENRNYIHYAKEWAKDHPHVCFAPPETDNRTVFTLISYLFSAISIDPTKLPTQQLIQVQ